MMTEIMLVVMKIVMILARMRVHIGGNHQLLGRAMITTMKMVMMLTRMIIRGLMEGATISA